MKTKQMTNKDQKTILLVEDEPVTSIVEKNILEKHGYNVITADTGGKAIETVEATPSIDLILMDINLGSGMDGATAAEKILKTHDLPLIFLSSHTEREVIEKIEKITSYGYIVKTSGNTVLIASIKMAFRLFEAQMKNKEQAQMLRESERNLSMTLKSIGDAVIATDTEGRIVRMNTVAEQLTGWNMGEALGRPLDEVFHIINQHTRQRVENPVAKVLQTGKTHGLANDTVLVSRQGTEYVIADSVAAIVDDKTGQTVGVVLVFRDVTEDHVVREALRESEERYRVLFEGSATGILMANVENKQFDYANPSICRMLGYTKEELTRLGIADIHPKDALEHVVAEFEAQMRGEKILASALPCLRKDGTVFYADIISAALVSSGKSWGVGFFDDITERKQAEEALKHERLLLSSVIKGTNVGTWEWNVQTGKTVFNDRWAEIIGYTLEELTPISIETWMKYAHPDDLKVSGAILEKHFKGELGYYEFESRMKHKDGRWVWVLDRGRVATWNADGKPLLMFGTHQDITERKQAEGIIQKQKEEQQVILDSVPAWIFYKDKENRFLRVNEAFCKVMGLPKEQLEGKTLWDFYPKDQADAYWKDDLEVINSGQPKRNIIEPLTLSDRALWVQTDKILYRDASGNIAGIIGFTLDITERKRTEEEIKRQAGLINSLLDSIPDIIFFKDINGVYLGCNPPFAEFVGRSRAEIIGKTDYDLFDKEVADFFREHDRLMLELRQPRHNEEWITYPDGRKKLIDTLKTPYWGPDGTFIGVLGVSRDITERKQAEEKLKDVRKKLVQSDKLAAVGLMAAGVAHEINNPLAVIMSSIQMLLERIKKEGAANIDSNIYTKALDMTERATNRCRKIVAGLLVFSAPARFQLDPIDIREVVEESLDVLKDQIKAHKVKVIRDFASHLPLLKADKYKLGGVFSNLITNACDAMPEGGQLKITTRLSQPRTEALREAVDEARKTVEIEFSDTGEGISEENMIRIFDPFFTTKDTNKGTGLGLSICYGIIKEHGGFIDVKSEKGKGTTFIVTLPVGTE